MVLIGIYCLSINVYLYGWVLLCLGRGKMDTLMIFHNDCGISTGDRGLYAFIWVYIVYLYLIFGFYGGL